jgi:hypothetical protein
MADYAEDTINKYGSGLNNFLSGLGKKTTDFFGNQYGKMTDYLTRLREGYAKQEGLPHMYRRIGDELNMPNLQANANTLINQQTMLPETYSKATRGFDVTDNQKNRIISTKAAALAPAVTTAQQALTSAQDEQSRRIMANQEEQRKQLEPLKTEQQMLSEYQAREFSGFTTENEMELNGLTTKLQAGIQLTEAEKGRAQQLLMQEKEFQNSKALAQMQIDAQAKYAAIPTNSAGLYNLQTGERTGWG